MTLSRIIAGQLLKEGQGAFLSKRVGLFMFTVQAQLVALSRKRLGSKQALAFLAAPHATTCSTHSPAFLSHSNDAGVNCTVTIFAE